ncbi:MAG: hypothetical protein KJ749_12595 [Planctomycetes bacterium]|nr:hypothetical protein [Planctomycetota bacterium]
MNDGRIALYSDGASGILFAESDNGLNPGQSPVSGRLPGVPTWVLGSEGGDRGIE